jgi:hypothetical protein
VAWGELLDKIAILEIKCARIEQPEKLLHVHRELEALRAVRDRELPADAPIAQLVVDLRQVNEELWDLEDRVRLLDRARLYDQAFVDAARSIMQKNDRRSAIKLRINLATGSRFVEQKHYATDEGFVQAS